jgi:DNA-binding MarR family transcriptional regulator
MSSRNRAALLADLDAAAREQAGRGLMLHGMIAERFGLNFTDLKCLDAARGETDLTAGRLAELTGMSTSAITNVLDRLERRGFIERRRDPADRRKVVVASTGQHEEAVADAFGALGRHYGAVMESFTNAQLAFLLDATRRMAEATRDVIDELSAEPIDEGHPA